MAASAREAAGAEQPLKIDQYAVVPVGYGKNPVDEIRPRNVQAFLRDLRALETKEILGLVAEQLCDLCHSF